MTKTLKPPLKWAGGKRWIVPHLKPIWEKHSGFRLVEPFCGGLAVALGLMPPKALLNDINPHLINFFSWLKKGLRIRLPMKNQENLYYTYREEFNQLIKANRKDTREGAELFYYLNRTCYNGLCRFNKKGFFNVPFGSYKNINYMQDFFDYKKVFQGWQFTCQDFEGIPLESNDFIYADPPYDVEFTQYSSEDFAWQDQVRLARWLAGHPGPVILSNQATPRIVALYKGLGYKLQYHYAPRRISCSGDRACAREVLAFYNI